MAATGAAATSHTLSYCAGRRQTLEALGGHGVPVELIGSVGGARLVARAAEVEVEVGLDLAAGAFGSIADRIEA